MDFSKFSSTNRSSVVNRLRTELWTCNILSEQRCLRKACEWTEDLLAALEEKGEDKVLSKLEVDLNYKHGQFNPHYEHARACFEMQEYDRAAYMARDQLDDDKCRFLHFFAMYKAAEKKRIDLMNEVSVTIPKNAMLKFNELRDSLERSMDKRKPDGWLLYVYGLVLHKFKLQQCAIKVLQQAIELTPINWSAWYILTTLIDSKEKLHNLNLPDHLFKVLFYHMMRLDLDMNNSDPWIMVGYKQTKNFLDNYFRESLFIKTLSAKSLGYQSHKYQEAMDLFQQIRAKDPYRVDSMENYSNLLFVKKHKKDLAKLAYDIERVDPFTPEANSCIANSFSAREQHTKAIVYFTRALRLNPDHLNSWTLIGHEYLEMKSFEKAQQAYRYAISINKRDCRAWLGLGNTNEVIMSSPNTPHPNYQQCLYYYSQVGKYRPTDPIMFQAMASIFEKMEMMDKARLCLRQAGPEGLARLAKLDESSTTNNSI